MKVKHTFQDLCQDTQSTRDTNITLGNPSKGENPTKNLSLIMNITKSQSTTWWAQEEFLFISLDVMTIPSILYQLEPYEALLCNALLQEWSPLNHAKMIV